MPFKSLIKRLSLDDAKNILSKVDNPEMATKLKGVERDEYLSALDTVYGDRSKRSTDMGFDDKTYYHGTTGPDFTEFDVQKKAAAGHGSYFTPDKELTENYSAGHRGRVIPVKLKKGMVDYGLSENQLAELVSDKLKFSHHPDDIKKQIKILQDRRPADAIEDIIRVYFDGDVQKFGEELSKRGITGKKLPALPDDPMEIATVYDASNIRSTNANFDPRFSKSKNIMAGVGAIPITDNPLDTLGYLYDKYEQGRKVFTDKIADMTNLVPKKAQTPDQVEQYKKMTNQLVDPLNVAAPGEAIIPAALDSGYEALKKYLKGGK